MGKGMVHPAPQVSLIARPCYTHQMNAASEPPLPPDWVRELRARGWVRPLLALLDALEPLGPLGAGALWIAQPALGTLISRRVLAYIAEALETPEGIETLRCALQDEERRG